MWVIAYPQMWGPRHISPREPFSMKCNQHFKHSAVRTTQLAGTGSNCLCVTFHGRIFIIFVIFLVLCGHITNIHRKILHIFNGGIRTWSHTNCRRALILLCYLCDIRRIIWNLMLWTVVFAPLLIPLLVAVVAAPAALLLLLLLAIK